jgi:hypothetical protein
MPVAALIVVRPGIEVKAIEGNSLGADGDRRQARAHVAIEPILVHAEIPRGVAESDEAGCRVGRGPGRWRGSDCGKCFDAHQRPCRTLWFRSFRVKLSLAKHHA